MVLYFGIVLVKPTASLLNEYRQAVSTPYYIQISTIRNLYILTPHRMAVTVSLLTGRKLAIAPHIIHLLVIIMNIEISMFPQDDIVSPY